jgi:DHA1 family bicyclomycin/chloramphenicol resistance-like MFS transporter
VAIIRRKSNLSLTEFVVIISMMMSLTALSIDAMLPALPEMGADLKVQDPNSRQLVVSTIFLGLAAGQLFFGPLSDRTGRKPAIYAGLVLYIAGALIAVSAASFPMLLFGRFLQGFGVSAPRAVGLALVRDRFEGRAMARVMSFIMTIFILVPMIAPTLGQAILLVSGWRAIFAAFVLLACISLLWFGLRMPETLAAGNRAPFSLARVVAASREIAGIRPALGYTVIAGFISGAHLGYLSSAQQLFQEQYGLGQRFPIIFAAIAFSIGLASFLNARLVLLFGMRALVKRALLTILMLSAVALGFALLASGQPPLGFLLGYLMLAFFCVGILFGNNNALAMQPLGHMAGIGAAIVGSLSTFTSVPLGTLIGQSYDGTVLPLISGLAVLSVLSLIIVRWVESEDRPFS